MMSSPEIQEDFDSQFDQYRLSLGNKMLSVEFTGDPVGTTIMNKDFATSPFGESENNSPGETTALYRRARQLMQQRANQTGRPLRYVFKTDIPKMVEWGKTTGMEIFGWETAYAPGHKVYFEGQVEIKPGNTGVTLAQPESASR